MFMEIDGNASRTGASTLPAVGRSRKALGTLAGLLHIRSVIGS